jgi:iron-sulfur cluster assembly protein
VFASFDAAEGGQHVLTLSEQAQEVIARLVGDRGAGTEGGLRITGTASNGETALDFDLASEPSAGDVVVAEGDARIFLDETAAAVLAGKTLDVQEHGDHFHFDIRDEEAA